jgi:CubicO group peptidase (beta-lactamase class C family)
MSRSTLKETVGEATVEGVVSSGFEAVADAFLENFRSRDELGASACVMVEGETMLDLWGGHADAKKTKPWRRDTVSIVYSCTKGATALCAHVLASQGRLDIEAPVIELWPEFGRNGKQRVTGRMMLDHSAGVPVWREKMAAGGLYEWDYAVDLLAQQEPFWEPGVRNGYHGITFGFTVGELVRRASGMSLGAFFQEAIARPLGLDFWIGLPEEIEPRVAPMIGFAHPSGMPFTPFLHDMLNVPSSLPYLFFRNEGGWSGKVNSRESHAAEIGAANGVTNARGLAGMYAPLACGGALGDVRLVDDVTLKRMGEVSMATHHDATLYIPTRFALGFMKSMDNRRRSSGAAVTGEPIDSAILGSAAFGHVGAGGSIGFADPACGLSFGYSMNRMGPPLLLNPRGQALVDATYKALGYRSSDSGVWAR